MSKKTKKEMVDHLTKEIEESSKAVSAYGTMIDVIKHLQKMVEHHKVQAEKYNGDMRSKLDLIENPEEDGVQTKK